MPIQISKQEVRKSSVAT